MRQIANLANLIIGLGVDDKVTSTLDSVERRVEAFSAKMDRVGSGMQSVGKRMSMFATLPIAAGFTKATSSAENLNESVNAVNQVFGEASSTIQAFARTSAAEVGLSASALNALVTPVGAMLQNVGFGANEAADASINLAKRASDMASVFNVDVDEALGAIQAGLRGEADPLERFGVGLSDAAVTAHALEMGLAGTAGELDANAKTQARVALLMKQTEKIAGDFAATSDQSANAQRIAAARAEDLAASFGQKLIPVKTKLLEVAGGLLDRFDSMSPAMQTAAVATAAVVAAAGPLIYITGTLVRSVGALAKGFVAAASVGPKVVSAASSTVSASASAVAALGRWIAAGARWAAQMVAQAARAAASMAATAAKFVAHYAAMAAAAAINAAKMAASWVVAMGPVGWVIAAVVALVALIVANWDTVKEWTGKAWDWISDKVASAWEWVTEKTSAAVDAIVGFFVRLWQGAQSKVQALIEWVQSLPGRLLRALGNLGRMLFDAGKAILQGLWDGMKRIWDNVTGWVGGLGNKIRNLKGPIEKDRKLLTGEGNAIMEGLGSGLASGWADNERLLSSMAGQMHGVFDGLGVPKVSGLDVTARGSDGQSMGGVVFEAGSVTIHNPRPEPASRFTNDVLEEIYLAGM